jgi:hypothetical protein
MHYRDVILSSLPSGIAPGSDPAGCLAQTTVGRNRLSVVERPDLYAAQGSTNQTRHQYSYCIQSTLP